MLSNVINCYIILGLEFHKTITIRVQAQENEGLPWSGKTWKSQNLKTGLKSQEII